MKRILDVLHCRVEDILKNWASVLPVIGDKKSLFGEQMNAVTVLLRTKYKNYLQATVGKLISNVSFILNITLEVTNLNKFFPMWKLTNNCFQLQENRNTRLKRILEETKEEDGEAEVRERMHMLSSQLVDSISNLHEVFTSQIFIATCRGLWDRMGQVRRIIVPDNFKSQLLGIFSIWYMSIFSYEPDCLKISRGEEGKPSLVQRILLCSWGKLLQDDVEQDRLRQKATIFGWYYFFTASKIRTLTFCSSFFFVDTGWYLCHPNAEIARQRPTRERSRAPPFCDRSSVHPF